MTIILIIVVIIVLALGLFLGYKAGTYHIEKENSVLRTQVSLLQEYSNHWAAESTNRYQLFGEIAQQTSNNSSVTLNTLIQLLSIMQRDQDNTLSNQEKEKINKIIHNATQILHE